MQPNIAFRTLHGADTAAFVPALANLRLAIFRDWPYRYAGDWDEEHRYLQTYVNAPDSLVFLVYAERELVGATTAVPLSQAEDAFQAPLRTAGLDPAALFYFGESLLRPAYRGLGLGHRFFEEREAHARRLGYGQACFCAVQRSAEDPRRPANARALDAFWQQRGYRPQPEILAHYDWPDVGDSQPTRKALQFWISELRTAP